MSRLLALSPLIVTVLVLGLLWIVQRRRDRGGLGVVTAIALMAATPALAGNAAIPRHYDKEICRAAKRHLPGVPCQLLLAQLWQESRLDPAARSPVGACGVGQFMPATWDEISRAMGFAGARCTEAGPSIEAAAFYMARLKRAWPAAPEWDRHKMGLGAYNAGPGNIRRARRECDDSSAWAAIVPCLAGVTGRHAQETIDYVRLIFDKWLPLAGKRS